MGKHEPFEFWILRSWAVEGSWFIARPLHCERGFEFRIFYWTSLNPQSTVQELRIAAGYRRIGEVL